MTGRSRVCTRPPASPPSTANIGTPSGWRSNCSSSHERRAPGDELRCDLEPRIHALTREAAGRQVHPADEGSRQNFAIQNRAAVDAGDQAHAGSPGLPEVTSSEHHFRRRRLGAGSSRCWAEDAAASLLGPRSRPVSGVRAHPSSRNHPGASYLWIVEHARSRTTDEGLVVKWPRVAVHPARCGHRSGRGPSAGDRRRTRRTPPAPVRQARASSSHSKSRGAGSQPAGSSRSHMSRPPRFGEEPPVAADRDRTVAPRCCEVRDRHEDGGIDFSVADAGRHRHDQRPDRQTADRDRQGRSREAIDPAYGEPRDHRHER